MSGYYSGWTEMVQKVERSVLNCSFCDQQIALADNPRDVIDAAQKTGAALIDIGRGMIACKTCKNRPIGAFEPIVEEAAS